MKKLIEGIIEFRRTVQQGYREAFGRLATGQAPDTLFVACSDSRVVPNTFASTNPGELFVIRNMGNLVPPCGPDGKSSGDGAEAGAIEFSVQSLRVRDIIICGHSECGAMRALIGDRNQLTMPNMSHWLRHGDKALELLKSGYRIDPTIAPHNQLSQLNVLLQMEHVKSYPAVKKRMDEGSLQVHGWWFEIAKADVFAYDDSEKAFKIIDEDEAERMLRPLQN